MPSRSRWSTAYVFPERAGGAVKRRSGSKEWCCVKVGSVIKKTCINTVSKTRWYIHSLLTLTVEWRIARSCSRRLRLLRQLLHCSKLHSGWVSFYKWRCAHIVLLLRERGRSHMPALHRVPSLESSQDLACWFWMAEDDALNWGVGADVEDSLLNCLHQFWSSCRGTISKLEIKW